RLYLDVVLYRQYFELIGFTSIYYYHEAQSF
ncbi:hypothetical protein A5875_003077, partial [Enterococcus sp. 3H8_DIV0648]